MERQNPYKELETALVRMKNPLTTLTAIHHDFVLQNVESVNSIRSMRLFRKSLEGALESKTTQN